MMIQYLYSATDRVRHMLNARLNRCNNFQHCWNDMQCLTNSNQSSLIQHHPTGCSNEWKILRLTLLDDCWMKTLNQTNLIQHHLTSSNIIQCHSTSSYIIEHGVNRPTCCVQRLHDVGPTSWIRYIEPQLLLALSPRLVYSLFSDRFTVTDLRIFRVTD